MAILNLGRVKGDPGERGVQGIQGEQGMQGLQGIQGIPGELNTGDIKENVATFEESETDTDIVSGEKIGLLFGKIVKSIKTLRSGKIDKANIANNLVSTNSELVLGATQGKVLKEGLDTINNNLATLTIKGITIANTNVNIAMLEYGTYLLAFVSPNDAYISAYIVAKLSVGAIAVLMPIKVSTNIVVTGTVNGLTVNTANYAIDYTLTRLTKFTT